MSVVATMQLSEQVQYENHKNYSDKHTIMINESEND